ncbi:MAG: hypothetical protein WC340_05450 [Kiritimatiellia bacterium]
MGVEIEGEGTAVMACGYSAAQAVRNVPDELSARRHRLTMMCDDSG